MAGARPPSPADGITFDPVNTTWWEYPAGLAHPQYGFDNILAGEPGAVERRKNMPVDVDQGAGVPYQLASLGSDFSQWLGCSTLECLQAHNRSAMRQVVPVLPCFRHHTDVQLAGSLGRTKRNPIGGLPLRPPASPHTRRCPAFCPPLQWRPPAVMAR